jgi:glutamine amidotransferase-like uncharacterized protein
MIIYNSIFLKTHKIANIIIVARYRESTQQIAQTVSEMAEKLDSMLILIVKN